MSRKKQDDLGSGKLEESGDSEDDGLGLSEATIDEIVRRLEAHLDDGGGTQS